MQKKALIQNPTPTDDKTLSKLIMEGGFLSLIKTSTRKPTSTKQTNKQKTYINIICNSELETSSLILGLGKDVPSHHCFLKLFLIEG